jgi:hypothetical protein
MIWWPRQARIQWEFDELARAGFAFDKPASTEGEFMLPVYVTIDGKQHRLEVDFPELYPYFRFEVRAPQLDLPHHQHPFGKNLCLMPRGTEHWHMRYSLAAHLKEQLPKVVSAGTATSPQAVTTVEEHQAEPVTDYYGHYYEQDAIILIDTAMILPDDFTVGRMTVHLQPREHKNHPVRGTVQTISTIQNQVLHRAPAHLQRNGHTVEGFVIKLDAPEFEESAEQLHYQLKGAHFRRESTSGRTSILAVVMPEEHAWRNQTGQGWLFIVAEKGKGYSYVRAGRAGREDLIARAPELRDINNATIVVAGLGCNGGISAMELAKAGPKELRLVDHDFLDAGTLLRWYLGVRVAGLRKATVLAGLIDEHYPLTKAVPFVHRIGGNGAMLEIAEGASLIYDATAEPGISYFLAELARHQRIPYIHVSGTQGGWGGVIVRLTEKTGCWYCLEASRVAGRIPAPPADISGNVQPAGCSDPTFTGAGFDLATIALAGVRTAVSTLSTTYPSHAWDVMIISLRDEHGSLIAPRYDTYELPRDPACLVCG